MIKSISDSFLIEARGSGKTESSPSPVCVKVSEVSKVIQETEDLHKTPRKLTRPACLHDVMSESTEISRKSSGLWQCLSRTPNEEGGYIYHFQLKSEFDDISSHQDQTVRRAAKEQKLQQLFPAVEDLKDKFFILWDSKQSREAKIEAILKDVMTSLNIQDSSKQTALKEILHPCADAMMNLFLLIPQLGYEIRNEAERVFLSLPDKEALLSRWNQFRLLKPELPPLHIMSSEGIASDMEYVEAFFSNDVLLSEGAEFVHDHFFHVLAIMHLMLFSGIQLTQKAPPEYKKERSRLTQILLPAYHKWQMAKKHLTEDCTNRSLEELKLASERLHQFEAFLATFTDAILSYSTYQSLQEIQDLSDWAKILSNSFLYRQYWVQRFGKEVEKDLLSAFLSGDILKV